MLSFAGNEHGPLKWGEITPLLRAEFTLCSQMKLLEIDDAGIRVKVDDVGNDTVELKVSVTTNFVLSWERVYYSFTFSKSDFKDFVISLSAGKPGWHGSGNFWYAKKILVKKPNHPYQFRDLKLMNRFLIIGLVGSATFSKQIIDSLRKINI